MTNRQKFVDYVRNGAPYRVCSPQIGAGAGFDSKLAGKEWITQTTLEDTIAAVKRFNILPLINLGLCDLAEVNPALTWKQTDYREEDGGERKFFEHTLETPKGNLTRRSFEEKIAGCFAPKYPINEAAELDVLEWYVDAATDGDFSRVTDVVRGLREQVGDIAALSIQWAMQPYEILCFPNTVTTVMLAMQAPEQFVRIMDKIVALDEKIIKAVAKGGADFVFLGGPGSEMISPMYYDQFIIPYSKIVTKMAHDEGLLIYSHICSPVEPFLTMGYYNQMGIDLFETLSPPPVGNVASLADAMTKIDPAICTRGNLGLDVMLKETPAVIREKTFEMLEQTEGRKHMIAASDYLFYNTPEENVAAMADAVAEYNAKRGFGQD